MADMAEAGPELADGIYAWKDPGYLLIERTLVPDAFIAMVQEALGSVMLRYAAVYEVDELFSPAFLSSLAPAEIQVLPHCVMHIIESGDMAMHFPDPEEEAV